MGAAGAGDELVKLRVAALDEREAFFPRAGNVGR